MSTTTTVAYVLHPVADREPAARPHLVAVLASSTQPATAGFDRLRTRRCRGRGPERPRCPGEHGEGTLGRQTATRITRRAGVEHDACIGTDSVPGRPTSGRSRKSP